MQSRLSIFYLQPYSARPECPRCSISYHCPLKCGSEESSPLSLHKNGTKTPWPKGSHGANATRHHCPGYLPILKMTQL